MRLLNSAEDAPASRSSIAVAGVMLVIFLYAIDGTVVSAAMPTVVARLGDIELYSWVFSVYMLTSALATPLFGKLSDLFGRRRLMLVGLAIFTLASLLCGAAQTMTQLIFFRAVQGIGGGAMYALSFIIVGVVFPAEQRARMQGMISGVWGVSSLLGPLAGGLITEYWSWRWIFFINLPGTLIATVLIVCGFREVASPGKKPQLDLQGGLYLLLGLLFLFFSLAPGAWGGQGPSLSSLGLFFLALATLTLFVVFERSAREPIIPPDLFRLRLFKMSAVVATFASIGVFGAISYLPLYVQGVLGRTASQAGTVLLVASLAWTGGSMLAGQGMNRLGYRAVCMAGMGLMTLGYGSVVAIAARGGMIGALVGGLFIGTGMGMVNVTALVASQNAVPVQRIGVATATIMLFRTFGGAFGVSVMGSVLFTTMARRLVALSATAGVNLSGAEMERLTNPHSLMDPATRLLIPDRFLSLLVDSLADSMWYAFFAGLAMMVIGLCSSFFVDALTPQTTRREQEPERTPS